MTLRTSFPAKFRLKRAVLNLSWDRGTRRSTTSTFFSRAKI